MTLAAHDVPLALTCWTAWASSPDVDPHQLTHAVTGGRTIALCGMRITTQGAAWPADPMMWPMTKARCHVCAGLVHRNGF